MNKTKIAVQLFDDFAKAYEDKFMGLDRYRGSYELFCGNISTKNAKILEIACGPGNITKYLLSQRPDFRILGTDLAPKMIELAKTNNPTAEFQILDGRRIGDLDRKFHGIMCGFGLPYFSKEEAIDLIVESSKILFHGGVIYLSIMEGNYEDSGWEGPSSGGERKLFIHYHQADYLTEALKQNDFEILNLKRVELSQPNEKSSHALILISRLR